MATCKHCGKPLILSGGKCLYCGFSSYQEIAPKDDKKDIRKPRQIIQRPSFVNRPKSIGDLRIKVTSPRYDNIGQILDQLKVKYSAFDGRYDCDILFLNCGTSDVVDPLQLNSFIQQGGILYASDLTSSILVSAWPEIMSVNNNTSVCTIPATIVDSDLRQYLGGTIDVEFDLGSWSKIVDAPKGIVLMRSTQEGFPIMVEFSIGQGKVFYTSFHNHAQTAEAEKKLLQLLVIKQVSTATKQDFRKTVESFPVNLK